MPVRLLCPWDSPGRNTGMGCHFLLQGIFMTQGLNLGLLHCRWILYSLSHQGIPRYIYTYFIYIYIYTHKSTYLYLIKYTHIWILNSKCAWNSCLQNLQGVGWISHPDQKDFEHIYSQHPWRIIREIPNSVNVLFYLDSIKHTLWLRVALWFCSRGDFSVK